MQITERQRLQSLYEIAHALHHEDLNVDSILQTVLSMTGKALGAAHGCIVTFDEQGEIANAFILGADEHGDRARQLWEMLITRGVVGFVHHGQRTITIRNITTDPRWPKLRDMPFIPKTGSAVGVPLRKNQQMFGVMLLIHTEIDFFTQEMIDLLETIANIASGAIGNAMQYSTAHTSQARYQWLFEDAIVPIIITDIEGTILDANRKACSFLKYKRESLLRMPIGAIHRMGTGPVGASRFENLQGGKEIEFRSRAWTSQGDDIAVSVRARRLSYGEHDVIEWVEQDITAHLELEQLRADLTAMVYHDLRGPLHNIHSSLSTLGRLLVNIDNSAILNLIQVSVRSTRQLSRLVESLLDIQRLEEGKAVLNRKQTSLHGLLANAAELVQPLASESKQRLKFDLDNDLPFVTVDSDMLLRVVVNLMENAIKYTPSGGSIKLGAKRSTNEVLVTITDSGPGIPGHMQKQIFDKFSRVKYADAPKGVGLGLAFCRLAVEAHGGHIWVESELGHGSVFCFTIPVAPEPALAAV
jgi:two-component system, NtrC family, sensor histidine kinase KinB